jgi:hypothetical protein
VPAPDFIDNLDGNTLAAAIGELLEQGLPGRRGTMGETGPRPGQLDIATAFFSPAGFAAISDRLEALERIRLIVGAEPPSETRPPRREPGVPPEKFERDLLRQGLGDLEEGLREERDRFPFTRGGRASLRKLIEVLKTGRMETRRYERAFMHAKAYVFAPGAAAYHAGYGVIAGSSNLTRAGVTHNLELNLGRFDDHVAEQARAWYERLWEEAVPFDLVELLEEVFAEWTPYQIFLRTLYQLYGAEVEELALEDRNLPLTSFQKHGAARAMRLIRDTGGAIVADEVGLGKTFIAGEILKLYLDRRQRCLLICPAQLRDTTWRKFRSAHFLGDVECLSYEELYLDRQIAIADPDSFQEKLERPLREYQLVVVDEAHNYRNPDTPTRAQVLRRLLWGQKRDVLLLTATPVNNSLWDLYHLIRYYMRQDAFLADRGILSIRERFEEAAREDPSSLSPDMLYPIIDATTVKRTRRFVKKHYGNDVIRLPDGSQVVIVFPEPRAITVRYALPDPMPALFDRLEAALDPNVEGALTFARYAPECYLRAGAEEDEEGADSEIAARAAATMGLLRSGLLKRFESSAHAFRRTVSKLVDEHIVFLDVLDRGHVVTTRLLHELAGTEDEALEELLAGHVDSAPAGDYRLIELRADVERDLRTLRELLAALEVVTPERDPKLAAIADALKDIARQAEDEAVSEHDARQRRKVIVFSFFADTVSYLRQELERMISSDPALACYRDRIVAVAGSSDVEPEDVSRQHAVAGFAPVSTESPNAEDRFDLLIATDVLAEGVNLQQCRHIINYDVPWNPMRLVQRHGRVDRIGSPHNRVFLRTIFPAERLDQLLNLEARILRKIALAAASVGVASPVEGGAAGEQVFTETREEIERLLAEDATLFERGGSAGAGQTGEEYRQTLRKELERHRDAIVRMPYGIGSGMLRGTERGIFFCAAVGTRTYLRFVPSSPQWDYIGRPILREIGTCLRLIECGSETPRHLQRGVEDAAYDLWEVARRSIFDSWMAETDPANLQPRVRPLNHAVAEFIRAHPPTDADAVRITAALDILEAPWPRREEMMLRELFRAPLPTPAERSASLIEMILGSGLEPFTQPPLLPPIELDDIQLVCWMGIEPEGVAHLPPS